MYIAIKNEKYREEALKLSDKLGYELRMLDDSSVSSGIHLELDDKGLSLVDGKLSMRGDYSSMIPRIKKNKLAGEMLVKAAKREDCGQDARLLDATAGMGEDSLILAAAGFHVTMYERDPVIAALLEDALGRAKELPELAAIAGRMKLICGDSIEAMNAMASEPVADDGKSQYPVDVILLDPMFPERDKSGLIGKKFQLLQQLESPCESVDENKLLDAAIALKPKRIVVKRPAKGPNLAGIKPDYVLDGKAVRYDILINLDNKRK